MIRDIIDTSMNHPNINYDANLSVKDLISGDVVFHYMMKKHPYDDKPDNSSYQIDLILDVMPNSEMQSRTVKWITVTCKTGKISYFSENLDRRAPWTAPWTAMRSRLFRDEKF